MRKQFFLQRAIKNKTILCFILLINFVITINISCLADFITGWSYRDLAQYIYIDNSLSEYQDKQCENKDNRCNFIPEKIERGSIIFTYGNCVKSFFANLHGKIQNPYILITFGNDLDMPNQYVSFLESDKIIAWFGINPSIINHPKFVPIPIGVFHKKVIFDERTKFNQIFFQLTKTQKKHLLYLNFDEKNHPERVSLKKKFYDRNYVLNGARKNFMDYLKEMSECKFVLSPRGVGLDCYRTWEAIFVGTIPIVKSSMLNSLYKNLPILIIDDWMTINEEYLNKKYHEINKKKYNLEKLYIKYWIEKINLLKKDIPIDKEKK